MLSPSQYAPSPAQRGTVLQEEVNPHPVKFACTIETPRVDFFQRPWYHPF